ncbi:polysaccharide deacetylase family protein [Culicoidibacter larvae]|uniref:Polysaccharide deacetylase n=1 Tax=Culicoidibacter larvae TaxID=2579976 RepID=A0A5R8QCK5_9FIRM|nr:polysaccharide deacetylase family protein [Culicoidibacter larvae]TLG74238.1 polysaccharide deacetylase [Culicoidibacter larvae]
MKDKKHKRKLNKKRAIVATSAMVTSLILIVALTIAGFQVMNSQNNPVVLCNREQHHNEVIENNPCLSKDEITALNQSGKTDKRIAFLTFDDGPSSKTSELLAILDKYNVNGNFFLIGNNIDGNEEVVKAIAAQGSKVFVHSTTHNYTDIYANVDAFRNDITATVTKIKQLGISSPYMYRFPGGSNTSYIDSKQFTAFQQIVHEIGMEYVDWNVDSGDASGTSPDAKTIVANVMAQIQNKNYVNILMHDAADKAATRAALPEIIEALRANGFIICKLPRGIAIPQFN